MTLVIRQLAIGLRYLLLLTVLTGIAYPAVILGIGQLVAPAAANGSPVTRDGGVVGSALIGQGFEHAAHAERWFWRRPSAADYDGLASGGSNLAAGNPELLAAVERRRADLAAVNGVDASDIPPDALTSSGSGLDPEISPAYARIQVDRVATARGLEPSAILALVEAHISEPLLGFVGQPRVNVLELTLALDQSSR